VSLGHTGRQVLRQVQRKVLWPSRRQPGAGLAGAAIAALLTAHLAAAAADQRHSGYDDMSPAVQAMQRDDSLNPALLWVGSGEAAWRSPAGRAGKACADCHGSPAASMLGVATRYPSFDSVAGAPLTLAGRIDACRTRHQQAPVWAAESEERLALEAFVARQSRGLPIAPPADPRLAPFRAQGERLFTLRQGQLDLSCAQCHDGLAGRRLGGSVIPQGHATAYPVYRLEWQGLGSLQRRLRNCLSGVRAQVPAFGDADLVALELYLMQRAAGLTLESPGVRP
jgi:L-cysteine S-thiosulfotransferase